MAGPPPSLRGGPASVAPDDTALAMAPVVPPPARSGPSPLVLAAIGGAVFFVLAVVLLFAVGGDETAPVEASASAPGPAGASGAGSAPRVAPEPTGPTVAPVKKPGGPSKGPGHPSHDAPGRNR